MFPATIETERLRIRRLSHDTVDLLEYYRVCSVDEPGIDEIVEHIPRFDPHRHPKQTKDYLDRAERLWEEGEAAEYVLRPKGGEPRSGEIAGGTSLSIGWDKLTAELGIWLRKPFWGHGYSAERASALMDVAFNALDLELVEAVCVDGNGRSKRAIEKYVSEHGGTYEGLLRNWMVSGDGDPLDCHRFTISETEFSE